MAYPQARSMNASLNEGATDGKYKKIVNDRDGDVEHATYLERIDLNDNWFGIHEAAVKRIPGGRGWSSTPNAVPSTSPQDVF